MLVGGDYGFCFVIWLSKIFWMGAFVLFISDIDIFEIAKTHDFYLDLEIWSTYSHRFIVYQAVFRRCFPGPAAPVIKRPIDSMLLLAFFFITTLY